MESMKLKNMLPAYIIILIFGFFFCIAEIKRTDVDHMTAEQLHYSSHIQSSDFTYNWIHGSIDFSLEFQEKALQDTPYTFVLTHHNGTETTCTFTLSKGSSLLTASIPVKDLKKGDYELFLQQKNGTESTIPLLTFVLH